MALSELLEALRAGESVDLIRSSVEMVLQALIDAEASEVIGAAPHERSGARTNQRNGTRPRLVTTKAPRYFTKPAMTLMVNAMITVPKRNDSIAWCNTVRRNSGIWRSVSATWNVIPIVNARYAKSRKSGS